MSGDARARAITDLVSRFGTGPAPSGEPVAEDAASSATREGVFPTKGLGRFLDVLRGCDAPVLLDLGAVVGANVTFFGEELGCKLFVEDLFADLERMAADADPDGGDRVERYLQTRIAQPEASVDGVLCWDALEHLTAGEARTLASALTRVLRPGGVLFASFGSERRTAAGHTKYEIVDRARLRHRFAAGASRQDRVLQSREMTQIFGGLTVAESFLLTTQTREMIFRKPGQRASDAAVGAET